VRIGDRLRSLTTSMYFDIRIGVIRVETIKQFKYLKIEKFKKKSEKYTRPFLPVGVTSRD
jgi:hypothetical protein